MGWSTLDTTFMFWSIWQNNEKYHEKRSFFWRKMCSYGSWYSTNTSSYSRRWQSYYYQCKYKLFFFVAILQHFYTNTKYEIASYREPPRQSKSETVSILVATTWRIRKIRQSSREFCRDSNPRNTKNPLLAIVESTYPNLTNHLLNSEYFVKESNIITNYGSFWWN